ncbi:MAG: Sec-independent protein translocase protein TatB [Steroidobacteraceae bacterium]
MFEVGFSEIILILGLALLVLGPERLPELAAKVGRWTGRARAMARQFQAQLEQEVTIENVNKTSRQHAPTYPEASAQAEETIAPTTAQHEPLHAEPEHSPEPAVAPAASAPQPGSDQPQQ